MNNLPKQVVKKYTNKLLSEVLVSQRELLNKIDQIHETQFAINHNQLLVSSRTDDRLKNSGTVTISDNEMLTKIFSGLKMYLDPRDVTITPHLALDSIWEHDITAAWLKVLGTHDVVIDIGANFGYFGALAGQKTVDDARIYFFEANPHLIPYIRKTLAANWLTDKSNVENVAVSDKKGTVTFNVSPHYLGNASLSHELNDEVYTSYKIEFEELETVTVPALTIDEYSKKKGIKKVDLIKMDIEGFEETAYQGMRGIIKKSPDVTLFVEFTREGYKHPKAFYDQLLKDFGYVYTIQKDGSITKPKGTSYTSVIGNESSWVMPIFSKRKGLDKL